MVAVAVGVVAAAAAWASYSTTCTLRIPINIIIYSHYYCYILSACQLHHLRDNTLGSMHMLFYMFACTYVDKSVCVDLCFSVGMLIDHPTSLS